MPYYLTGDAGYKDEDDCLWVMSRTDDVINLAGHRLSTGAHFLAALEQERPLQCVGTINAYHALLAEASGFRALFVFLFNR